MASATREKLTCLRDMSLLEEQLKISPRMKSYSRDAKKEKIQAKCGGLTPGTPTSKEQEFQENRRIKQLPFSCVIEVDTYRLRPKDDIGSHKEISGLWGHRKCPPRLQRKW